MHCHYYRIFALVVVFLVSWTDLVYAHSAPARPLKRVAHPSTLALEILPRQRASSNSFTKRIPSSRSTVLRHDDSFRLIIAAFDDKFHLHLRPNDHLIHPAARVTYYTTSPDGRSVVSHYKPLLRESVKAYWGEVIQANHSPSRMREDSAGIVPNPSHPSELGWARIMVHHQGDMDQGIAPVFEGAFSVNGVVHHVMTKDNYLLSKHALDPEVVHPLDDEDSSLVIWRDSDVMSSHEEHTLRTGTLDAVHRPPHPHTCGHDGLPYNTDPSQNPVLQKPLSNSWFNSPFLSGSFTNRSLTRRDDVVGSGMGTNFVSNINQTAGCPKEQKVLFMGVAADCKYTAQHGSHDNATKQILTNWNTASSLYKQTFNISLGIIELQIQNLTCPTPADPAFPWNVDCPAVDLNGRLSLFSQWRGDKGDDGVGLWHLMSACPTGPEVGIAWLATLCQQTASGKGSSVVSGTAVSTSGRTEWQVVAHEIGHNFGAIHDCADGCNSTSTCCPLDSGTCNANAKFIMSPVAQPGESDFSPCSLGNICSLMQGISGGKSNISCLVNPDASRQTISLQMCGNGIVEQGEDCDPGQTSNSTCCDTSTCKFRNGAVCDPDSSTCCTDLCSFAPPTQVCRPSKDDRCDTAESCTGNSSSCPTDSFFPNGRSCGDNDLKCASGQCTSIAQQCQSLGASMNLKQGCPNRNDNSCKVSCQDPLRPNQCVVLSSSLIDGSPCGYGGTCVEGKCQANGFLDTAKAWYTQNLQISIPVTVVAGIVALLLLWAMITGLRRCCASRRPTVKSDPQFGGLRHERVGSYDRPAGLQIGPPAVLQPGSSASYTRAPPAVHGHSRSREFTSNPRSNWVDERLYNGPRR